MKKSEVVGGGMAGCEAAGQCAHHGVPVTLFEMRPVHSTPIHSSDRLAEIVCSNSLKSLDLGNAHGLLKALLQSLGPCSWEKLLPERRGKSRRRHSWRAASGSGVRLRIA